MNADSAVRSEPPIWETLQTHVSTDAKITSCRASSAEVSVRVLSRSAKTGSVDQDKRILAAGAYSSVRSACFAEDFITGFAGFFSKA